jgi:ubiquinone/menaquinone biosynthesis C-methylase UbiE
MTSPRYVHGYSPRETVRLGDQAQTLADLLHGDEEYPAGALVLEAGCGTGAQTVILARKNPAARFVSADIAPDSLELARQAVQRAGLANVRFEQADLFRLPFPDAMFDAVFVCFVLEHLSAPLQALAELSRALRPGGIITVIEGDHGSAYFHPESALARKAIQCLIDLQQQAGGDALIGRRLYPLLCRAGFTQVRVTPRVVYADASRPEMVEGFTRNTFNAMVEGIAHEVLRKGMMDAPSWQQGIADLHRTAGPDGVFNYTFFKARGLRPT